ncbi:hypothetical protein [Streptomyces lavendulae]|uniref:hypothetical protein n=1 Tax=Streptomyces lavendulae TaxID=1914 RepID=UPI002554372E|nr:hypothetical protein [Streptomyces lavendulae]
MTTDLGLLTSAAAKWEGMAGELKKVETRYGDTVQKITLGDNWSGVSAGVARTKFTATRYEYSAAQNQAMAIASLLRGAHEQFSGLKAKLESARDDAIAAGMTVSEQGHVAFDYAKLTAAERSAYDHDPDGRSAIRTAVDMWQKHIDDRVKAVIEADVHVKDALEAAVVDSNRDALGKGADETLTGFNNYAEGDLAKAKKHEPADIKTHHDPVTVTGPDIGWSASGIKYGKEGSVKAYADLFHASGSGEVTFDGLKLSGVEEVYGGVRATGNLGATDKGVVAKGEMSAGLRFLQEARIEHGPQAAYGRLEAFAGGEVSGTGKLTQDEVTIGGKVFAGGKLTAAGGVESGGLGVGLTGEGWAGKGAEASFGWRRDEETGAWKVKGKGGLSPIFGGAVGLEITVDPGKIKKTAGEVAHEIGSWFD